MENQIIDIAGSFTEEVLSWVLESVEDILNGKTIESSKTFNEGTRLEEKISMLLRDDDRIVITMNSFGFEVVYSWKIDRDVDEFFALADFRLEGGDLDETWISSSSYV